MPNNIIPVITGVNCITPMGDGAEITAESIKDGIGELEFSDSFFDLKQNAVKIALIDGFKENEPDSHKLFMNEAFAGCFSDFLEKSLGNSFEAEIIYLFLGLSSTQRPGIQFDIKPLIDQLKPCCSEIITEKFTTGNPSAINALEKSVEIIKANPDAICIVGAVDSLLNQDTLDWFEKDQRLNSEDSKRPHGFCPSQAVSFFSVESKKAAINRKRAILAEITGFKTAKEPSSFVSGLPSKGEGLTNAVRGGLENGNVKPESINHVFCDLNGEFYRSKEWGFAEIRCLGKSDNIRELWSPSDCMGNIGAASAGVLLSIVSEGLNKNWLDKNVLVFSSDDHGDCGAVVLSGVEV